MKHTKWLAMLLTAALVLSLVPMTALAANETVTVDGPDALLAAVENGGDITLTASFTLINQSVVITKDTTINFGENNTLYVDRNMVGEEPPEGWDFPEATFIVQDGATLTLNCSGENYAGAQFHGTGSLVKLIGAADKATSLVINRGNHRANGTYTHNEGFFEKFPASVFAVEAPVGTVKPSITINGGVVSCATMNGSAGPLLSGDACDLVIQGGRYYVDPQAYLAEGCVSYLSEYDGYVVLDTSMPVSEAFGTILTDGKMLLNRYEPTDATDVQSLLEMFYFEYGVDAPDRRIYFKFHDETYDAENQTIYASRVVPHEGVMYNDPEIVETHLVPLSFVYDAAMKAKTDALIAALPAGEWLEDEYGEWYEPYYFRVDDLALVNYLVNATDDEYNTLLINYSTEFKEITGYKNFVLDTRMGTADMFSQQAAGLAEFKYNGTVYGVEQIGARADLVLYVPDDTADTPQAMLEAAQKRVDDYIGAGKLTLEPYGTVADYFANEYGEDNPDDIVMSDWTQVDYITLDMPMCKITVADRDWYLVIIRGSAKMTPAPTYKTVDFGTAVEVGAADTAIPLDTVVQVEQLTSGDVYDKVVKVLDVTDNATYDIQLHSGSANKYITALANGQFEVKLPVPASLEGKSLVVYYVNDKDEVEEHTATVSGGFAAFTTDHFSVYTLAEAKVAGPVEVTIPKDEASVELGKEIVDAAAADGKSLVVTNNDGVTATFDAKALETISSSGKVGDKVSVQVEVVEASVLTADQQKTVKDLDTTLVLSASVLVGGKEVADFNGGEVTVEIPFTPAQGMRLEDYTLVYIRDDGRVEIVPTKVVDGKLYATLTHFSEYAVVKTASAQSFVAQQKPLTSPATGDALPMGVFALVACAVLAAVLLVNKKRLMP